LYDTHKRKNPIKEKIGGVPITNSWTLDKDMSPSSFTIFARKIKGSGWSKRHIRRKFLKQVEKDDYAKSDLARLLDWCVSLGKIR